jgi:nicotinamide-nucleotide amidase
MPMRSAEIIAIGSELLLGGRLDTNSLLLTEQLASCGIEVRFKSVVGDEERDIASALRAACQRADVVVLTGGLGPTKDDRTRSAVAHVTERPLRRSKVAAEAIRRRLAAWGRVPSPAQLRQGLIPSGAEVLFNPVGTAPGFALTWNGSFVAALPGVPSEAEHMFAVALSPWLAAKRVKNDSRGCIERRTLHTFGIIESEVDQRLKGLAPADGKIRLGLLVSPLGVTISVMVCGDGATADAKLLEPLTQTIRRRLGKYIYAEGVETMEEVVGRLLTRHHLTVAVAESCTGGLIGHRLTQVPGSSNYFDRGIICYSNEAKQDLLGVPTSSLRRHGAVSMETAAAMAKGVRLRSRTDIGLSVTGIAGPGGGTDRKPVGLVYVGLDAGRATGLRSLRTSRVTTQTFHFHGDRQSIKLKASQAALDMLRRWLVKR